MFREYGVLFINLRLIGTYPNILKRIGIALGQLIKEECREVNRLVGIAGVPIATAISLESNLPMCYTRKLKGITNIESFQKEISKYCQHDLIKDVLKEGDNVALIDELATKLHSKIIALEQLKRENRIRSLNIQCNTILLLLDREQRAFEKAKKK